MPNNHQTKHVRSQARFAKRHHSKTTTLMRVSVNKPGASLKRQMHVYSALDARKSQKTATDSSFLIESSKNHQSEIKKNIPKSPLIQHFSETSLYNPAKDNVDSTPNVISFASKPSPSLSSKVENFKDVSESSKLDNLLTSALEQATSHEQPPHKIPSKLQRRLSNLMGSVKLKKVLS